MAFLCLLLFIQLFHFKAESKKMILVKEEYHHYLVMLKKTIQNENYDDLEIFEDKESLAKTLEESALIDKSLALDEFKKEEEILDEQDEDTEEFQFISAEDEKQLKDLREKTRQVSQARKKNKIKSKQKVVGKNKKIHPTIQRSVQPTSSDFTFHWPLELHHFWISSLFGTRKKANGTPGFHYGIDLAAVKGTSIKAAAAGTVIQAQYLPGYGNNILIQHNEFYRTRYAHLYKMNVSAGQVVKQGQKIGAVGDTGSVRKSGRDASHLHFEIYHNGSHVNPLRYLFN